MKFDDKKSQAKSQDSVDDNQKVENESEKFTLKSEFLPSPFYSIYCEKLLNKKTTPELQRYIQKNVEKDINYFGKSQHFSKFQIHQIFNSKINKVIKLRASFSAFALFINILNLTDSDRLKIQFQNFISEGTFGCVYEAENDGKRIAVKEIPFKGQNSSFVVYNAIKEFCIMKLLSVFEVAPLQQNIFGFDLITTQRGVYFSTERCFSLDNVLRNKSFDEIKYLFSQLQTSLLIAHKLNITHNDIKPENIMYSPSLKKLVFIDFGLSQQNIQKIGEMKIQLPKGSLFYCSQQMRKLFLSNLRSDHIDMYYNDLFALEKSADQIKQKFHVKEKNQEQEYKNMKSDINLFSESILYAGNQNNLKTLKQSLNQFKNTYKDFENTYLHETLLIKIIYLITFQKSLELEHLLNEHPTALKILSEKFEMIYFIFMQVQFSQSLYIIYTSILNKIKASGCEIVFFQYKFDERILDSYWRYYTSVPFVFDNSVEKNISIEKQGQKRKIEKRCNFFLSGTKLGQQKADKKVLLLTIDLNEQLSEEIQKTVNFLNELDNAEKLKKTDEIYNYFLYILNSQSNKTSNMIFFDKMFKKRGIIVQFTENSQSKQNDKPQFSKGLKFYFDVIYEFYFQKVVNFSSLKLFESCILLFFPQKEQEPIIKNLITKFQTFMQKLKNSQEIIQVQHQELSAGQINYIFQSEFHIFQNSLFILASQTILYGNVDLSYNEFKNVYKRTLSLFNGLLFQYLSFKLIIEANTQTENLQINLINYMVGSVISKFLHLKQNITKQAFGLADKYEDLIFLVETFEQLFVNQKIINLPENYISLLEEVQSTFDRKKFLSFLEFQIPMETTGLSSLFPECFKKLCSLMIFTKLIPKQLNTEFEICQQYFQLFKNFEHFLNPKLIESHLRGFVIGKLINVSFEENRFQLGEYFFLKTQHSVNKLQLSHIQSSLLKLNKKHLQDQKNPKQKPRSVQNKKNSVSNNSKIKFPPKQITSFQDTREILKKNRYFQSNLTNIYNQSNIDQLTRNQFQFQLKDYWEKILKQQTLKSLQQYKEVVQRCFLKNFIYHSCWQMQQYLQKYNITIEKILQQIKKAIEYLKKNQEASKILLSSIGFTYNDKFWEETYKKICLFSRLGIFQIFSLQFHQFHPFNNLNLQNSYQFIWLKKFLLEDYYQFMKIFVSQIYGDKVPLAFYETVTRINLSIYQSEGSRDKVQRNQICSLACEYFRKVELSILYQSRLPVQLPNVIIYSIKSPKIHHLNNYLSQQLYIDLLSESYQGFMPQIKNLFILNAQNIINQISQKLNNQEKLNMELKFVFYYMVENKEINRFFCFKRTYTVLIFYLLNIGIQQLVFNKKCSVQKYFVGQSEFFIVPFLSEIFKFNFKHTCSNYSYFSIKVVKQFLLGFKKIMGKQQHIWILETLQKIKISILDNNPKKHMEIFAPMIAEFEVQKQEIIQQMITTFKMKITYDQKLIKIAKIMDQTQVTLLKICFNVDSWQYLAKNFLKQRVLKVALMLMKNKEMFKKFAIDQILQKNQKTIQHFSRKHYMKLKYLRSIRRVHTCKDFERNKNQFLLRLNEIDEVFESILTDQLKDQFLEAFEFSFICSSIKLMIENKVAKLIKNVS